MKCLFLLLLFPAICLAQHKDPDRDFILKVNATSFVDIFSFPTLQLSLEKRISKNISVAGEVGYQIINIRKTDTAFINTNGIKGNVEFRRYNILKKIRLLDDVDIDLTKIYAGINFFYRKNQYSHEIAYTKSTDTLAYIDGLGVEKQSRGGNLVIGYQNTFSGKYVVDVYTGFGIKKTRIRNFNREISDDDIISGTDLVPLFASWNLSEHSGRQGNVSFGIRLGIIL